MADELSTDPVESTEVPEVVPEASVTEPTTASGEPQITEPTVDWEARLTEWGGEETIEDALAIYHGLADPEGVANLFIQAGRELGLGDREMQAFIQGQQAPANEPDPYEEEDLDSVMTRREFLAELDKNVLGPQREQAAAQQAAAYEARVASSVTDGLAAAGVPDDVALSVLALANTHLTGDSDAEIRLAINKGWDQFQAQVKAEAAKYVSEKQGDRDNTPGPLTSSGTGAPGGEEVKPPNFEEHGSDVLEVAIKRARARLVAE